MISTHIGRLGLSLIGGLVAAASAQAEQLYYYADVAGGQSKIKAPCNDHPNCKTSAFGGKLVLGYEFTKLLAVEGGFHYFGPVIHAISLTANDGKAGAKSYAYNFSMAGAMNMKVMDRLTLKGRLGAGWTKTTVSYTTTDGQSGSGSELSLQPLYGVGASVELLPLMSIGVDYDATRIPHGGGGKQKLDTSLITMTARYHF